MADTGDNGTPLLDELEKGPWPSFVTEIKKEAEKKDECKDLQQAQEVLLVLVGMGVEVRDYVGP